MDDLIKNRIKEAIRVTASMLKYTSDTNHYWHGKGSGLTEALEIISEVEQMNSIDLADAMTQEELEDEAA